MTSRERWTIYPLLFLAIGLGLRNRVMGLAEVPAVECQTLTIVGPDGKPAVRLGTIPSGAGQIDFFSPDGKVLLAAGATLDNKSGQLILQNSAGKVLMAAGPSRDGKSADLVLQNEAGEPQVELGSHGNAGMMRVFGPDGEMLAAVQSSARGGMFIALTADRKLQLITGHDSLDSGVLIDTANGQRLAVPFGPVVRKPAPPEEKPAEPAAPKEEAKPKPAAPAEKE